MSFFELDYSEKDLAGADHLAQVQRALISAFLRKAKTEKMTKAQLARALGVEKSTVSRMLSGKANLTSRTIGELCWALDVNPKFLAEDFPDRQVNAAKAVSVPRVSAYGTRTQTVPGAGGVLVPKI